MFISLGRLINVLMFNSKASPAKIVTQFDSLNLKV